MEIPRMLLWIVLLLVFGSVMAEATNYIIINTNQGGNATTNNVTAENVMPGTFGLSFGGGNFTFPQNLTVTGTLVTGKLNVDNITAKGVYATNYLTLENGGYLNLPTNSVVDQYIQSLDAGKLFNVSALNYQINVNSGNIQGGIPYSILVGNASAYCPGGSVVQNVTLINGTIFLNCVSGSTGNLTGSGTTPYVPYFTSSSNLASSPIYVDSSDKIVVNGTANFTGMAVNNTFYGDVQIIGKLYGGSPVKIAGGLNVISGDANFTDIYVSNCFGCAIINGTTINASNITAQNFIALGSLTVNPGGNISFPNQSLFIDYLYGTTSASCPSGEFQTTTTFTNGTITVSCAAPMINVTSIAVNGPYLYNITSGNTNTIYFNETYLNQTVNALISEFNATIRTYNESGITRNYTLTGAMTGTLPVSDVITIKGILTPTSSASILLNFNSDVTNSYLYRRVQGLNWLYQAVTVNPQKNITLEQYQSTTVRDVTITIYRTGTDISGEFLVTAYVNGTMAPYKTMGSFNYKNSSSVNTFSISPAFTGDSYLIVTSENK